jgi:hypothetical protein
VANNTVALVSVLAALFTACSAPQADGRMPSLIVARPLADAGVTTEPNAPEATPTLSSVLIQKVPEGTFGPYRAARADGRALVVWAAQEAGAGRRWYSAALDARGAPLAPPLRLSEAPARLGLVALRPTAEGFVVVSSAVGGNGTGIEALGLGGGGELSSNVINIAHTHEDVLWLDALGLGASTTALYAVRAAGSASLYLVPVAQGSAPQREPLEVLAGALAWQAVAYGETIALAAIAGRPGEAAALRVQFLDAEGRALGTAVVSKSPRLRADLDAAVIGNNLVLVWTELEGLDARLFGAALGADGQIVAPARPLLEPSDAQELVRLVPPLATAADGFLAWGAGGQARVEREILLARLSAKAELTQPPARLRADAEGNVEFAATGLGLAALTRADACQKLDPVCDRQALPTFVEWSNKLELIAAEPFRLAALEGRGADLGWALACARDVCSALAAASAAPVPIYGVELRARSNAWRAPASAAEAEAKPKALRSRSVFQDEPLAAIASGPLGPRTLVAWLTEFDPSVPYVRPSTLAPDGRRQPVRALLRVSSAGVEQSGLLEPVTLSYRAHTPGGLALAPESGGARALVVWSALDDGRPQVFVTLVDRAGKRIAQRMLTRSPGQVEQITGVALPRGGFVVAWIKEHEGQRRVQVARLAANLAQSSPHQELASGASVPGEIRLLAAGDAVWLARSEQSEDAVDVLTLTALDPSNATPRGPAQPLRRVDAGRLSSLGLEATGSGMMLLWVEHGDAGEEPGKLQLLSLDPSGRAQAEPNTLVLEEGRPEIAAAYCRDNACNGIVAVRERGGERLEAFTWAPGQPPAAQTLLWREPSPSASTQPIAVTERGVWYAARRKERGLLRHVLVQW